MLKQLSEIQKKLNAPKTQYNDFGKYKYRSCEDILSAVKPLLEEATIVIHDEIILIGDRYYVKATATFSCPDGEELSTAYAREPENKKGMDASQITGTASSYARKYALNGLLMIDDTKDADHYNNNNQTEKMSLKDVKAKIDKAKDVDDLVGIYKRLSGAISMLNKTEQDEIVKYCGDIKAIFENEKNS